MLHLYLIALVAVIAANILAMLLALATRPDRGKRGAKR